MFERLEFRRLFSVYSHTLDGAVQGTSNFNIDTKSINLLLINPQRDFSGTAKNDVILVSPGAYANDVRVTVNGKVTQTTTDQPITLRGNGGNDKIHLDLGDEAANLRFVVYGGAGDDTITGSIAAERIIAGDGNDIVNGMGGRDTIYGEGGDDSIRGGGSSDFLDGGADNDTVRGDAGNDRLLGSDGFDRLRGSAGNDSCEGGASKDFIGGETGDDELNGDGGDDVLAGGEGNDFVYGGAGRDNCDGNDGDDLLAGGSGEDQLIGSGGNDGFDPGDPASECLDMKEEDLEPGYTGGAITASNTVGAASTSAGKTLISGSNSYSGGTLAMYTYAGDANLDGLIGGDDYSAIDFNIVAPGTSGWANGDFNNDGIISGDDYGVIDFNIVAQGNPFPT